MNSTMIKLKNLERSYSLGKEKFFYVLREINLDVEQGDLSQSWAHRRRQIDAVAHSRNARPRLAR